MHPELQRCLDPLRRWWWWWLSCLLTLSFLWSHTGSCHLKQGKCDVVQCQALGTRMGQMRRAFRVLLLWVRLHMDRMASLSLSMVFFNIRISSVVQLQTKAEKAEWSFKWTCPWKKGGNCFLCCPSFGWKAVWIFTFYIRAVCFSFFSMH